MKLTAALACLCAILAFLLYGQYYRAGLYAEQRDEAQAEAQLSQGLLITERKNASDANDRNLQLAEDKKAADDELQTLRTCIDNLTCGVRVKTVRVTVPDPSAGESRTAGDDAGHCEISGSDYRNLREAIATTTVRYKALQREVIARSEKDYCEIKKDPIK